MSSENESKDKIAIIDDLRTGAPVSNISSLPCFLAQSVLKEYSHEDINSLYDTLLNAIHCESNQLLKVPEQYTEDVVDLLLVSKDFSSVSQLINKHSFNKLLSVITVKSLALEFYNTYVDFNQDEATFQREIAMKSALYMQSFIIDPKLMKKEHSLVGKRMGKKSVISKKRRRQPYIDYVIKEFNRYEGKFCSISNAAGTIASNLSTDTPAHLLKFVKKDPIKMMNSVRRIIDLKIKDGELTLNKS